MKQAVNLSCCKRSLWAFFFVLCYSQALLAQSEKAALYLDYTQPVEKRVQDLMSRMNVEDLSVFP